MRIILGSIFCCVALAIAAPLTAQQAGQGRRATTKTAVTEELVDRMMAFDANEDGKLTRSEVTDQRLLGLFDRADANRDKVVTRNELNVLLVRDRAATRKKSSAAGGRNGRGFGGPGGPGGGPGFGGPGGPGGGPGFGGRGFGPPQPGQILPQMLRQRLELTPEQERQVDALQKEVDAKLAKILTAAQKQQLQQMRQRGPGGFGPPPGGGPPPDGFGPPPGGDEPPPPPDQSL